MALMQDYEIAHLKDLSKDWSQIEHKPGTFAVFYWSTRLGIEFSRPYLETSATSGRPTLAHTRCCTLALRTEAFGVRLDDWFRMTLVETL